MICTDSARIRDRFEPLFDAFDTDAIAVDPPFVTERVECIED